MFIELHHPDDQKVLVNVNQITTMTKFIDRSIIYLVSGGEVQVKESLSEIKDKLRTLV